MYKDEGQWDSDPPHGNEADKERLLRITSTSQSAGINHGHGRETFGNRHNAQGIGSQLNHFFRRSKEPNQDFRSQEHDAGEYQRYDQT